jgi:hypothetical protein
VINRCHATRVVVWDVQAHFMRGTVLNNADNLRKLYMVNMNPEAWDENEMLYRSPQHWQAVTVSTHVV